MEKLLEQAKKFLEVNLSINEVELTDNLGNKVRVVRISPCIYYNYPLAYYNPIYFPTTNPLTGTPY